MGCTIISRTVGGTEDKRISVAQGQFGRLLAIGSNWNSLRICLRLSMTDSGANLIAPTLYAGVCSGTTDMVTDAATTNFFGIRIGNGATNWTRGTSGGVNYNMTPQGSVRRVGTTVTTGVNIGGTVMVMGDPNIRSLFMFQITKGSPNFYLRAFSRTGTTGADVTLDQFLELITVDTPVLTSHQWWGTAPGSALACDEVAGAFDAVNVYWDRANPALEISDIAIVRMS